MLHDLIKGFFLYKFKDVIQFNGFELICLLLNCWGLVFKILCFVKPTKNEEPDL